MVRSWFICVLMVFALVACNSGSSQGTSPTSTLPSTPTLVPPTCPTHFSTTYYSTLPEATFQATNMYAQIPLPPLTRFMESDALGGERGKVMCSAGTSASVLNFMTQHLGQLGWQQVAVHEADCPGVTDGLFGIAQCWKNGTYTLFLGIKSNTDWLIIFHDPDYPQS